MLKLGLTGGIATGKSTVSKYLKQKGLPVVDADAIAALVVEPGQPALAEIAKTFGTDVIKDDGTLDRKKLGAIVFSDSEALAQLNAITHPAIYEEMHRQIDQAEAQGHEIVILDIPLLFESHNQIGANQVMVVSVPTDLQLERLMARNQLTKVEAQQRIDAQLPLAEKVERADYVIDNAGSPAETYAQVDAILQQLQSKQ